MKYCCNTCQSEIKIKDKPVFCPFCGGQDLSLICKQRETALRLIAELEDMKEEHNRILAEYAEIRVAIEYKHQTLRVYKKRGYISAEEMPVFEKPKVSEYLKEYRQKKRKEQK